MVGDGIDPFLEPGKFRNNDCPKPNKSRVLVSSVFASFLDIFAAPMLLDSFITSSAETSPRYFQSLISLSASLMTPGAVLIIVDSSIILFFRPA